MRIITVIVILICFANCHSSKQMTVAPRFPNLTYLVKDTSLYQYFSIDTSGIEMFASPEDKAAHKVEIKVFADEIEKVQKFCENSTAEEVLAFYQKKGTKRLTEIPASSYIAVERPKKVKDAKLPLKGWRIALDPGHIEATMEMAEIEAKFIKMRAAEWNQQQEIGFNEANLTLATAVFLKQKLEKQGATVMITRPKAGLNLMDMTYQEWFNYFMANTIQEEMNEGMLDSATVYYLKTQASPAEFYRKVYVPYDLKLRAEKINAFRPDLTLMIHYNVHGPNWEKHDAENYCMPTDIDYSMAFVAGSFMKGELVAMEDRAAFLRLLLTQDLNRSIDLSGEVVKQYENTIKVRAVSTSDSLLYLEKACILTPEKGVYARNLSLTRMINGTLCYGEALCQDNLYECLALNKRDLILPEVATNERVEQVAEAYYRAILAYANKQP